MPKTRSVSKTDLRLNSEFNYINSAGTFTKQKRKLTEARNESPGPGHYNVEENRLRNKSPNAVIPQGGKRIEFARQDIPGPTDYTPIHHFIAKYS